MKPLKLWLLSLSLVGAVPASAAGWTSQDIDTLSAQIAAGMARQWSYGSTQYPWQFLSCTAQDKECFGTNPGNPYGAPNFGPGKDGKPQSATTLAPGDALVLVMQTPPPMRYFGFTSYLVTRYYPTSMPSAPLVTPGFVPVFESLNDTFNLSTLGATGPSVYGAAPFGQLSLVAMAADGGTRDHLNQVLDSLGVPAVAVNWLKMPVQDVPLQMGKAPTQDTYSILMRLAYAADPKQLDDYQATAPVRVLYLRAPNSQPFAAIERPTYTVPGSPPGEAQALADAQGQLLNQLLKKYGQDYRTVPRTVTPKATQNYNCIATATSCAGDNPDAVYYAEVDHFTPSAPTLDQPQDRILIVGVNHVSQGKATYQSHSVVAAVNDMGVDGVSDTWLAGSGLAMGGVTDPRDPRYATYSQLYAFTMSYNCQGDPWCLTIVEPHDGKPGIPYGDPVQVTGRTYLDPKTRTRPNPLEIITPSVYILRRR